MKATFTLLPDFSTTNKPFTIKEITKSEFDTDFHFHNECQLVYIASGKGTRVIGDSIEKYNVGDLTFIGSNVPHVWYSSKINDDAVVRSVSIALYISPEAVLKSLTPFINISELPILFKEAERGLRIEGNKKKLIIGYLTDMTTQNGIELMSTFLKIIGLLVTSSEMVYLNEQSLLDIYSVKPPGRVSKLMTYIHHNFQSDITLASAASVVDLQIHSFCRYFKSLTNRTFTDFLNEVRISNACKLLQNYDLSISQVAFDSGFSNISYFNRIFKKLRGTTPREYRFIDQSKIRNIIN